MKIVKYNEAEKVAIDVEARKMCFRKDVELIRISLAPGEEIGVHSNPFDTIMYFIEGNGFFNNGEKEISIEQDMAIEIPKNELRGIRNSGTSIMKVLVYKIMS